MDGSATEGGDAGREVGSSIATELATFDTDLGGFAIDSAPNPPNINIGAGTTTLPLLLWDSVEGSPTPGALQVTAPFTDYNQTVELVKDLSPTALEDWSGKTLHVRVKIASGGNPTGTPMAVEMGVWSYLQGVDGGSGTWLFAGQYTTATPGSGWQEFTFSPLAAQASVDLGWDATKIIQFGIGIDTTNLTPVPVAKPTTTVIYIDSFSLVGSE